jgi:hypothetical protein
VEASFWHSFHMLSTCSVCPRPSASRYSNSQAGLVNRLGVGWDVTNRVVGASVRVPARLRIYSERKLQGSL